MIVGKRFMSRRPEEQGGRLVWYGELFFKDYEREESVEEVCWQLSDEQFAMGNVITISDMLQ